MILDEDEAKPEEAEDAYQQYGFSSPEELDEARSAAYAAMQESLTELKQVEKTLNGKKELQRQVLAYSKTRPVRVNTNRWQPVSSTARQTRSL